MHRILFISLVLLLKTHSAFSQEDLVLELEGMTFRIIEYQKIDNPCQIYGSCQRADQNELIRFFKTYFESPSLEDYRALYLEDDWFGATESRYQKWQSYIKQYPLVADAYFIVEVEGYQLGIVAHYLDLDKTIQRKNFVAKKIESAWRPTGGKLDNALKRAITIMSLIKPDHLQTVVNDPSLIDAFLSEEDQNRDRQDQVFLSPFKYKTAFRQSNSDKEEDLREYMTQIDVQDSVQSKVIDLIRQQKYFEAVKLITVSQDNVVAVNIARKLNEIYGEQLLTVSDNEESNDN